MAYCNKTPTTSIHLSYLLPSPNVSTFFLESACSITFHESATVDGSETLRSPVGRRSCFSGIYRFLYIPGGAGFLNHPQYHPCDLVFLFHLFRWTSLIQHQVTAKGVSKEHANQPRAPCVLNIFTNYCPHSEFGCRKTRAQQTHANLDIQSAWIKSPQCVRNLLIIKLSLFHRGQSKWMGWASSAPVLS